MLHIQRILVRLYSRVADFFVLSGNSRCCGFCLGYTEVGECVVLCLSDSCLLADLSVGSYRG